MIKFFKKFRNDDSGAVTVDWVVLTAAVVVLGGAVVTSIKSGAEDLTDKTGDYLGAIAPTTGDAGTAGAADASTN